MQKTGTPDKIAERLRVQPNRHNRKLTAAALVRTYYEEIRAARSAPGHLSKTWQEIAEDLSIHKPIRAGAVARAYSRISAERDMAGTPKRPDTRHRSTSHDIQKTSDLFGTNANIASPHSGRERRSPFGHQVDTFGLSNDETGEA